MNPDEEVLYREKLLPSIGFFLATLLIIPSMIILFLPFSEISHLGIWIGIGMYLLIVVSFIAAAPKVIVTTSTLQAGKATIEKKFLENPEPLDPLAYKLAIGRKLDARAYLAMSAWAKTGLKVAVADAEDPTPYWIISTKKPVHLAQLLQS